MRYSDDMPNWFISAKELWKMLIHQREVNKDLSCAFTVNIGINQAVGLMNSLPAADVVEVVHAEWIEVEEEGLFGLVTVGYECSRCGCFWGGTHSYCPDCGAKMDGERRCDNEVD